MSVAQFFSQKCIEDTQKSEKLLAQKLADPSSLVQFNISGALVTAAEGGLGSLADFAGNLIQQNSDKLLLAALQVTGLENSFLKALNLAYALFAAAFSAHNDLVLIFMKQVAKEAIVQINAKAKALNAIDDGLRNLYNALTVLTAASPVYEGYLTNLRNALLLVDEARADLQLVSDTLSSTDVYLAPQFAAANTAISKAIALIKPEASTPFLKANVGSTLNSFGIPTTGQQTISMLLIPKLSANIISASTTFFASVVTVDALILAYTTGVDQLSAALPGVFKQYLINLLQANITTLTSIEGEMANVLNGGPTIITPNPNYTPTSVTVVAQAYKWVLELQNALQYLLLFPNKALTNITLSEAALAVYKTSVKEILALNGSGTGQAVLIEQGGQESTTQLESELLSLMTEANLAIVTASIRQPTMDLIQAIIARNALDRTTDQQIVGYMTTFINTPIPLEQELTDIANGLAKVLKDMGLDRAADLLKGGSFSSFFSLNSKTATYAGAALAALSLLMQCFNDQSSISQLKKVQAEIQNDQDLLNIKLSFDFDLGISALLADCLRVTGLANIFLTKEILCGLITGNPGAALTALNNLVSF